MARSQTLFTSPQVSSAVQPGPGLEHEEVRVLRGNRTGVTIVVAVHSTQRGSAIGGLRMKSYSSWRDGLEDVLRLSAAMTTKCALAGVPYGGGKTVAVLPPDFDPARRADLIADLAQIIDGFNGRYISGPDIGTSPEDMAVIYRLAHGSAFCRPESDGGSGNSSSATARGVLVALRAGARHRFGTEDLTGKRVGVIGFGHVGRLVAEGLVAQGAQVHVTDVNLSLAQQAEDSGAVWTTTDLLSADLDILVPAATGGLLTAESAATCQAKLIVGPANNQLVDDSVEDVLRGRAITWVPDVLASAGGVIHAIARERQGLDAAATDTLVDQIGDKVDGLLSFAADRHTTPLRAAYDIAARETAA